MGDQKITLFPTKPLSKYKRGELGLVILKGIAVGGIVIAVLALPGLAQVLTLFKPKDSRERYKIKRTVTALAKQRYIKKCTKNGREMFEITKWGRKRLLQYDFDSIKIARPKKWDKKWRMVMFDIPEKRKRARDLLRIKLEEIGFYPFQHSAFVFPYQCKDEIDFIKEHLMVHNYVKYVKAVEIEDMYKLKKHFGLM